MELDVFLNPFYTRNFKACLLFLIHILMIENENILKILSMLVAIKNQIKTIYGI